MLLRKHKLQSLFYSNPKFFFILELLPVKTQGLTAIKKLLTLKGFDLKYLRTREALGILKKLKHLKIEKAEKTLFKSNLICIRPLSDWVLFQDFPLNELALFKTTILVGFAFEGLFYNPLLLKNIAITHSTATILRSLDAPAQKIVRPFFSPMIQLVQILELGQSSAFKL